MKEVKNIKELFYHIKGNIYGFVNRDSFDILVYSKYSTLTTNTCSIQISLKESKDASELIDSVLNNAIGWEQKIEKKNSPNITIIVRTLICKLFLMKSSIIMR